MFGRALADLTPADVHALLERLRADAPGFFKQLRMDVAALPQIPGSCAGSVFRASSTETGGYPE